MGGFNHTDSKEIVCEGVGWIKLAPDILVDGSCKILATLLGLHMIQGIS